MTKDTQPISIRRRDLIIAGAAAAAGFLVGKHSKQLEGLFDEKPLYSPETGHTVRLPFLEFFNQYGLEVLGHPISEATLGNRKQYSFTPLGCNTFTPLFSQFVVWLDIS